MFIKHAMQRDLVKTRSIDKNQVDFCCDLQRFTAPIEIISRPRSIVSGGRIMELDEWSLTLETRSHGCD